MSRDEPALLDQLGDLAVVEVDALLAGLPPDQGAALARAHVAELERALDQGRAKMSALEREIAAGADPLAWVDWPAARRSGEDGAKAADLGSQRLAHKAELCRDLARLAEALARLAPRLVAAQRLGNASDNS